MHSTSTSKSSSSAGQRRLALKRAATILAFGTLFGCDPTKVIVTTEIDADITTATTWTTGTTYHVIRSISVNAPLTLEPGVTVTFDPGVNLTVNGSLLVDGGSAATPIVFTSAASSPAAADWGGITVRAAGSHFQHCAFYYAGADDRAALTIENGVAASVTQCTFAHNRPPTDRIDTAPAIDASDAGAGTVISQNLFYDNRVPLRVNAKFSVDVNTFDASALSPASPQPNQYNAVFVAGCGHVTSNLTWPVQAVPYVIGDPVTACNYLTIDSGGRLAIGDVGANAVVKLFPEGNFDVAGTIVPHAIFTSIKDDRLGDTNGDGATTAPAGGDWSGIRVRQSGAIFDQVSFLYGGANESSSLTVAGDVAITVTNSIFAHSRPATDSVRAAPALDLSEAAAGTVITGNTFFDDTVPLAINTVDSIDDSNTFTGAEGAGAAVGNKYQGIVVRGCGQIARTLTWSAVKVPMIIGDPDTACNYLTINAGGQLTLADQVIVKFFHGGSLAVAGTLVADAVTGITLTSFWDDANGGDTNGDGAATAATAGDWSGIRLSASGSRFDHVSFLYGGGAAGGDDASVILVQGEKSVSITSSVFAHVRPVTDSIRAPAAVDLTEAAPTGTVFTGNRLYDTMVPLAINSHLSLDDSNEFVSATPATPEASRYQGVVVAGCGQIASSTRWDVTKVPMVIGDPDTACNYLNVNNGGHLTFGPNVTAKFFLEGSIIVAAGASLSVDASNYLTSYKDDHVSDTNADGTDTTPAIGDWHGVKYMHAGGEPTCDVASYMHYNTPNAGDGSCDW